MNILPNLHLSLLMVTLAGWIQSGCCKADAILILIFAIDKDVIHGANYTGEAFKGLAHALLKVLCSTQYAKWHLVEAKPTKGSDEGGQQAGTFRRVIFPESTVGV